MSNTLNLRIGLVAAKVFTLFRLAKISGNYNKILDNLKSLKTYILSIVPILKKIAPESPQNIQDADAILRRSLWVMNNKYDGAGTYSDLQKIFKEVYLYMGKIMVQFNGLAGVTVASGAAIALNIASPAIVIPITVAATLCVFANAKKNGITYRQALINFKLSYREFLKKQSLTMKEKHLAAVPIILIALGIFLFKFPFTDAVIKNLSSLAVGGEGTWFGAEHNIFKDTNSFIDYDLLKDSMLTKENIKIALIAFVCITVLYLSITVLEQWVMRKGEQGSSEEV